MLKNERQDAIVTLVDDQGAVTVKDVAQTLGVSEMTIRRDLEELATQGRVLRVHGGARSVAGERDHLVPREFTHSEKHLLHEAAKAQVGARAAELVAAGDTVFLGAGTTTEQVALSLLDVPLRVVTNSLSVFDIVRQRPNVDVCLIGGTYRPSTDAFVGSIAEQSVATLGVDKAFIGANGVLAEGVSTSNPEEGRFQALVLDSSAERYLVTDASKLGRRDFFTFYELGSFDGLVTDPSITEEQREELSVSTRVLT